MKIAIVSDSHDNMANFKKIIAFANKQGIELMLHCGDIASQQTIDEAKQEFKGEIKWARGNADYDLEQIPYQNEIEIGGRKIAFCHFPEIAKKLATSGNYDMVCYGHTHRVWEEKIGKCKMMNPGESAGHFYKATFAIYDTTKDVLELKILERLEG